MSEAETSLDSLRRRAEHALERDGWSVEAERLLERLLTIAMDGSDHALFAHRHLAELRLERHPWQAALHLRKVVAARPGDDVPHALMGLCQALLGNYRMAVASYRRAVRAAPRTPWYHHNLGHLLDVAMNQPTDAARHLDVAHELEPDHDEISASYAHCLARLGDMERAERLSREAVAMAPRNPDHRRLLVWIEAGAPADRDVTKESAPEDPRDAKILAVEEAIEQGMSASGFTKGEVERAVNLWSDYRDCRKVRVGKPEVFAAAVEYAMALIHRREGVTQAKVARRYGVATTSVSTRYGEIRDALALRPGDPRYGAY